MGLLTFVVLAVIGGCLIAAFTKRSGRPGELADAEARARRWVERLGGQITALDAGANTAAKQALADASERHTAAWSQLSQAATPTQFALAGQTAIEGLHYIRAARTALGLDPGPEVPALGAEAVTAPQRMTVGGQEHQASPRPGDATPYYYPGGTVGGRAVPAGWYSTPWWKTALVAGAAGIGGAILADELLDGFHHHGDFFGGPGFDGLGDWF